MKFQFTRPRGARLSSNSPLPAVDRFNSRAREGRDGQKTAPFFQMLRFNSRAREGRDGAARPRSGRSICFNSRAREGRDARDDLVGVFQGGFNSRAREGRDLPTWREDLRAGFVSIHAPARGATRSSLIL